LGELQLHYRRALLMLVIAFAVPAAACGKREPLKLPKAPPPAEVRVSQSTQAAAAPAVPRHDSLAPAPVAPWVVAPPASRRVAAVTDENRNLYKLYREMIASPAPKSLAQGVTDEVGCLMQWYGEDRGRQLGEDAYYKALADTGDPNAQEKLERSLDGSVVEARDCAKKKPD
jgi:predicted small lipoprotein YifL